MAPTRVLGGLGDFPAGTGGHQVGFMEMEATLNARLQRGALGLIATWKTCLVTAFWGLFQLKVNKRGKAGGSFG